MRALVLQYLQLQACMVAPVSWDATAWEADQGDTVLCAKAQPEQQHEAAATEIQKGLDALGKL